MRRDNADVFEVTGPPALCAPASVVFDVLRPLVTDRRFARIEAVVDGRTYDVVPILDHVDDPHNSAAILRSADAFGVQRIHSIPGARGMLAARSVSKGAHRWLDFSVHQEPFSCAQTLTEAGYKILVADVEGEFTPDDLAAIPKVAIVFGNEHDGPSAELRELAHGTYTIPMTGFVESLNVSVAAAITLHAATQNRQGSLRSQERDVLLARYLMNTVRNAERIVREYQDAVV